MPMYLYHSTITVVYLFLPLHRSIETYHPLSPPSLPRTVNAAGDFATHVQEIWQQSGSLCILNNIREQTLTSYSKAGIYDLKTIAFRTMRSELRNHFAYFPTISGNFISFIPELNFSHGKKALLVHSASNTDSNIVSLDGYAALTLRQLAYLTDAAQIELNILENRVAMMSSLQLRETNNLKTRTPDRHSNIDDKYTKTSPAAALTSENGLELNSNDFQKRSHLRQKQLSQDFMEASTSLPASQGGELDVDIEIGSRLNVAELLRSDWSQPSSVGNNLSQEISIPNPEGVIAFPMDVSNIFSVDFSSYTPATHKKALSSSNVDEFRKIFDISENPWEFRLSDASPECYVDSADPTNDVGPSRFAKQVSEIACEIA